MTRSTTTIVEKFRPKATTWGERWFETLDHQHWEMSANCGLLVDGDNFVADAHHSFGHRVAKKGAPTCHPEACLSVTDWYDHYAKDRFTVWNGDSAQEGVLRLHQMHTADVGSALIVARSSPGSPPYITIVSGPVTTPVDLDDTRNHGAPTWNKTFQDETYELLLPEGPRSTHAVVASTAYNTRGNIPDTMEDLEARVKGVILTPGEKFQAKYPIPTMEDGASFGVLYLPRYCDPATGLCLPTDCGYKEFVELISGSKPYCALSKLMQRQKPIFENWFRLAHDCPALIAVNLQPVTPLWAVLPTLSNRTAPTTADVRSVGPFQIQRVRFLWQYFCDMILHGQAVTSEDVVRRDVFVAYLSKIDVWQRERDPDGWETAAAGAFIPSRFADTTSDDLDRILHPFLVWSTDNFQIPPRYSEIARHDFGEAPRVTQSPAGTTRVIHPSQSPHRYGTRMQSNQPTNPPPQLPMITPGTAMRPHPLPCSELSPRRSRQCRDSRATRPHERSRPSPSLSVSSETVDSPSPVAQSRSSSLDQGQSRQFSRKRSRVASLPRPVLLEYDDEGYGSGRSYSQDAPRSARGRSRLTEQLPKRSKHHHLRYDSRESRRSMSADSRSYSSKSSSASESYGQVSQLRRSPRKHRRSMSFREVQFASPTKRQRKHRYRSASPRVTCRGKPVVDDTIAAASLRTLDERNRCPPVWANAALLLLKPCKSRYRFKDLETRERFSGDSHGYVQEPTDWARRHVLATLDTTRSKVMAGSVVKHVVHMCNCLEDFPRQQPMRSADLMGFTDEFYAQLMNVGLWQVQVGQAVEDTQMFHPLDFVKVLDPKQSHLKIPIEGYSGAFAQRLGRVIYATFALLGAERHRGMLVDARTFGDTVFGRTLLRLCLAPFEFRIQDVWSNHAAQLSNLWFQDLCHVFHLVADFVSWRTGAGAAHAFVALEPRHDRNTERLCASYDMSSDKRRVPSSYFTRFQRLDDEFDRWYSHSHSHIMSLATQPLTTELMESKVSKPLAFKTPHDEKLPRKKQEKETKAFTSKTPLFTLVKTGVSSKSPQMVLRDEAGVKTWPSMKPLKGKGMRQVCFVCAFDSSRTCKDVIRCDPGRRSSLRGERLHMDLSMAKWRSYPRDDWEPLIAFQREWWEWIQPTSAFKALLPDADWKDK